MIKISKHGLKTIQTLKILYINRTHFEKVSVREI